MDTIFKIGDVVRLNDASYNQAWAKREGLEGPLTLTEVRQSRSSPSQQYVEFLAPGVPHRVIGCLGNRLELVPTDRPCIPPPAPCGYTVVCDCEVPDVPQPVIPQDDGTRKAAPMYRGLLGYFPYALFQVAAHAMKADLKHNPDSPDEERPTWAKGKSSDHLDCIVRHLAELHTDEAYHRAAIAWRALAQLQEYGEADGFGAGAHAVFPEEDK